MAHPRSTAPLKLDPVLIERVSPRADSLNLTAARYVSMLIWNFLAAPRRLEPHEAGVLARAPLPMSIDKRLRAEARAKAEAAGMSYNALVEALIAEDLRQPAKPLPIIPRLRR